jgi:hypothetical protein
LEKLDELGPGGRRRRILKARLVIDEHSRLEGEGIGGVAPVGPGWPGGAHRQVAALGIAVIGKLHLQVHRRGKGEVGRRLSRIRFPHDPVEDLAGQHFLVADGNIRIGLLEARDHRLGKRLVERRVHGQHGSIVATRRCGKQDGVR